MSIRTTDEKHVSLFDSVTGIAFGPVFEGWEDFTPAEEADAFERWQLLDKERMIDGYANPYQVKHVADQWRALLAKHDEQVCPWDIDRDSYGIGFRGDSDKYRGDYVESTPDSCPCECHRRPGASFRR